MNSKKDSFLLWFLEKQQTENALLNLLDASYYLGVNYNTISYASKKEKIKKFQWEKTIYYSLKDINLYLENSKNIQKITPYKVWYDSLIEKEKALLRMTSASYYCNSSTTTIQKAARQKKINEFHWEKSLYYSQRDLDNYIICSKRL